MTSTWFSYVALFCWPLVVICLSNRYSVNKAIVLSILWGYLLLPVGVEVDLPLIPPFNKETIPSLAVFVYVRYMLGRRVRFLTRFDFLAILLLVYIVSPFATVLSNSTSVYTGNKIIPGLGVRDSISIIIRQWILLIPFFLGRQFLKEPKDLEMLLRLLIIGALVYSIFVLFEVRMSPQLHRWVYGFHAQGFGQQKRGGGFRPTVFLGHGLWVAFYVMLSVLATTICLKLKVRIIRMLSTKQILFYLLFVLVLCKSLGSLLYVIAIAPLIYWASIETQSRITKILVFICILYPILRIYEYFPVSMLLEWAYSYDTERGQSLQFRFDQEKNLLLHARNKFLFGWGGWGRNRVYDVETGEDISVTDGHWIITLGTYGFIGFLAEFGLLLYPIYKLVSLVKRIKDKKKKILLSGYSFLLVIYVVDMLPNDPMSPLVWLIAGALYGNYEFHNINKKVT